MSVECLLTQQVASEHLILKGEPLLVQVTSNRARVEEQFDTQ